MARRKPVCPNGHPDASVTALQKLPRWHCLACLGEGRDHDLGPVDNSQAGVILDDIEEKRREVFKRK